MEKRYDKPPDVLIAEIALWAWTVWTCAYGVLSAPRQIAEMTGQITEQSQGLLTVDPAVLQSGVLPCYAIVGVICAFVVWALGRGKHWARSSVIWGVICEIIMMLAPPYKPLLQYLGYIPDIGLQAVAVYFLYTPESRDWFASTLPRRRQ